MALTVEDGSGLAGADALVSLDRAQEIVDGLGLAGWPASADDQESAIRRASRWLSTYYRYKGEAVKGRGQGLAFPRSGVVDDQGLAVADDAVPIEMEFATVYGALAEAASPGVLTPTINPGQIAQSEKVGPLAITYRKTDRPRNDLSGADDQRDVLTAIYDHVKGLIERPAFIGFTVA